MTKTQLSIGKIDLTEIKDVVDIHLSAFPGFFLTSLGPKFLRKYYGLVLADSVGIIWGVRRGNKELIGFAAIVNEPDKFYRSVIANKLRLGLFTLSHVLWSPRTWPKLFSRIVAAKQRGVSVQRAGCELISIGVQPFFSGTGVGKILLGTIFEDIAYRGGGALRLRTDRHDNDHVIGFYKNNGFEVADIERIGTREMLLLIRNIAPEKNEK